MDDVRVLTGAGAAQPAVGDQLLASLVSELADVPTSDVELDHRCASCGLRHGRMTVVYPLRLSGLHWYGDAAARGGAVVAAASARHPVAVAIEAVTLTADPVVDRAAFHADELDTLAEFGPERLARVRAMLWARKAALLRALGHLGPVEPSRLALTVPGSPGDADGGRVLRPIPELGSGWREIRFDDTQVPGELVATVAVLAATA